MGLIWLPIPRGQHHTARVTATVPRFVKCEECGHRYGYWLSRTGYGHAYTHWSSVSIGRPDRVVGDAEVEAEQKLKLACEAVPCPECGCYQSHMLDRAREERFGWLLWAGIGAGVLTVFLMGSLAGIIMAVAERFFRHGGVAPLLVMRGLGFLALPLGVAVVVSAILLRNHLSARYDPNDEDAEVRRQRGWDRAMSPKEYARVAPKKKGKGTHQKLRPEDLE